MSGVARAVVWGNCAASGDRLVAKHAVTGVKVYDARPVAAMKVHGIRRVLTFNTDDFARYEIEVVHPSSFLRD